MRIVLTAIFTIASLFYLGHVFAQTPQAAIDLKPDVGLKLSVERDLADLIRDLESAESSLKQKKYDETENRVLQVSLELKKAIDNLENDGSYREVALHFKKIHLSLQDVLWALQARRQAVAARELDYALRNLRLLQGSPVLKLSVTRHALQLANRDIANKNYSSAGLFLQQAIDVLTALEANSKIDLREVKALKSDIVVAHQQVILGKSADKSYFEKLYDRANAATTNVLYQYYDMWTMTPAPWNKY